MPDYRHIQAQAGGYVGGDGDPFSDTFKWSRPEGGMFIWVEGPQGFDAGAMYRKAVEKKVAYVPGKYFYAHDGDGLETMRLNFTVSDPELIEQAIHTLSDVIKSG